MCVLCRQNSDTKVYTMSYQYKRADVCVVVCNICSDFSWVGDPQWRKMAQSTDAQPIHLCKACRRVALWCPAHLQYHLPEALHRCACADCGGLFTSVVADAITRCPSCRRTAGNNVPPTTQPTTKPAPSFFDRLFSLHISK
jgi:hypothetical protein